MNFKKFELTMSIVLIVAVFIAVTFGLPIAYKSISGKQVYANSEKNTNNSTANQSKSDGGPNIVVIDSGHGGIDGGKEGKTGVFEKTINLSIAYKLKTILEENGIQVVMTRTDDNGLYSDSDSNRKAADMKKRCEIIESSNADLVVSIHQNSFSDSKVNGAQVFYYTYSKEGKKFAGIMQASLKENLNNNNSRVEKANKSYYMLVHTQAPTVIVECGFLSNSEEEQLLSSEDYQQKVAQALYNGIETYFGQE